MLSLKCFQRLIKGWATSEVNKPTWKAEGQGIHVVLLSRHLESAKKLCNEVGFNWLPPKWSNKFGACNACQCLCILPEHSSQPASRCTARCMMGELQDDGGHRSNTRQDRKTENVLRLGSCGVSLARFEEKNTEIIHFAATLHLTLLHRIKHTITQDSTRHYIGSNTPLHKICHS